MEETMDEKGYQTIITILDQRVTRRLWFSFHVILFITGSYIYGHRIQQSVPFLQDGNFLYIIWPLLVIAHFIYMCFRDIHGHLLRRRIEQDAAETQLSQYPEKRKNSRLGDEGERVDDHRPSNQIEHIRKNK
jgi:hypothetical protein